MSDGAISTLPLVGGHPAVDLCNTVHPRLPVTARQERLAAPTDLLVWATRASLIDDKEERAVKAAWKSAPTAAGHCLAAVRETRAALSTVLAAVLAGKPDGVEAELEHLSLGWAAAAARSHLVLTVEGATATRWQVGNSRRLLVADRVAHAAIELLRDVDLRRLGECPPGDGGCGWLYIDTSRSGSRRWCDMSLCGTNAKMRRLTERRRAQAVARPVIRQPE